MCLCVNSFDNCYKLSTGLKASTSWQLFDSWYRLLIALTAVTSCRQLWQLLQAVDSFDSCWQLLQAVVNFDSNSKLSTALTVVKSRRQLWQLEQAWRQKEKNIGGKKLGQKYILVRRKKVFHCYRLLLHFQRNISQRQTIGGQTIQPIKRYMRYIFS